MSIWDAAKAGDLAELERLVGQDPDLLNAKEIRLGMTPLMVAAREGHVRLVRWLLDKGAAINAPAKGGSTALWLACSSGHHPVVRLMLERGADSTIVEHYWWFDTPLMTASNHGYLEVVRLLLGAWLPSTAATTTARRRSGWPAPRAVGGS
jgi:uncharacterized protein